MKILVTGAGGQVGSALVDAATSRAHQVVGVDHATCPIDDADRVRQVVASHRPHVVVNCAAWTDVDACEGDPVRADRINGHAVAYLAQACEAIDCGLVHLSTDYVFAGDASRPYRPEDAPAPRSAYGRSKLLGEAAVLRAPRRPNFAVVRTSWVFGPNGRNFPRAILGRARTGAALRVVDDQVGSPTYAPDLAAALLDLIALDDYGGVWHACNSGRTSWFDFAAAILAETGLQVTLSRQSTAELGRPAPRPLWSVLDTSALTNAIGHELPDWRDALRRYLATNPA